MDFSFQKPLGELDFQAGAVLLIDKPLNWTSFDIVNKVRGALRAKYGIKKFKVGHTGTLDPLATGLVLVCTGKATKTIDAFMGMSKAYTGTIRLGGTTASYDLEQPINEVFPTDHIDEAALETARDSFVGTIDQFPPIFSAIKKNGVPLYKKARAGKEVTVEARQITINEFSIDTAQFPDVDFLVKCSKGTYIRSLAYDYGKALNSGGHLAALRRVTIEVPEMFQLETGQTEFLIEQAATIEQVTAAIDASPRMKG